MSRSILARLIALILVTIAGVYYILFDAVGVHIFDQPYTVKVDFPAIVNGQPAGAGGLYSDAYVTYRGVEIGKVSSLQLHQKDVVAVLAIDHGTKIPTDVKASVRELTAAAEQYLDLVPTGTDPPNHYLTAGATITNTSIPISIGTLLDSLNTLVDSLSPADLNTLTSALATGLQNAGGNLRQIIVDGNTLASALQSAIPGTGQLINAGNTVLSTFNATSNDFAQFSTNLDLLSQQLKESNSDLVALLQNGATAGTALDQFLQQNGAATVGMINDLSASTNVAYQRQPAIQALFEVLPLFASDVSETVSDGQVRFQLDFNTSSPVCAYIPTLPAPTQFDDTTAALNRNCTTEAPNLLQRGADKAP